MTVEEINPHLRFAMSFKYPISDTPLVSYDTHIYYIKSGAGRISSGSTFESFENGSVIIVPTGTPYLFSSAETIYCISINFDYTKFCSHITDAISPVESNYFESEKIIDKTFFEDYVAFNKISVFNSAEFLRSGFEKIESEFISKKQLYQESTSSELKRILIELLRMNILGPSSLSNINGILDYIKEHFSENITNKHLSNVFGYHPYHLNRIMKSAIGTTLHQYLIYYRMEMAKKFLGEAELSVLEISRLCGYNNFSNFSYDFKKKNGCTPLGYREKSRKR